jgi:type IV pilus assembly protein PilB
MVACPWCAATLDRGNCQTCNRNLDPDWRLCPWCRTPAVRRPVHQIGIHPAG